MSIKKSFEELVKFLDKNKDKKVAEVFDDILAIAESRKMASTVIKNEAGVVTHIFCYYHKQWEEVAKVEYGKKKSSATGLNTMCKVGVNKWTAQQTAAKKSKAELLDKVAAGDVKPAELPKLMEQIETARNVIDKDKMPKGTVEPPKAAKK